jgi:hypothetical protein
MNRRRGFAWGESSISALMPALHGAPTGMCAEAGGRAFGRVLPTRGLTRVRARFRAYLGLEICSRALHYGTSGIGASS